MWDDFGAIPEQKELESFESIETTICIARSWHFSFLHYLRIFISYFIFFRVSADSLYICVFRDKKEQCEYC